MTNAVDLRSLPKTRSGEEAAEPVDLATIGLSGERLVKIVDRPPTVSPLPGLLDPRPHVHICSGPPKAGKSTFTHHLANSFRMGRAPWPGAPKLPRTRVCIVSPEQEAERILGTIRRLEEGLAAGEVSAEQLQENLVVFARDTELPVEGRQLLTLDDRGIELLRKGLLSAVRAGVPFGLLVLDSLSRLIPDDVDENSSADMSRWLGKLEELAIDAGVYIILIHHVGHARGSRSRDARSAPRGSSAIAAVAQALWSFDRDGPGRRVLRVDGNAVPKATFHFRVAPADADPTAIHFFELEDAEPIDAPEKYLQPGEEVSQTELAWRILGSARVPKRQPSGHAQTRAKALSEAWQAEGLVNIRRGKGGAVLLSLRTTFPPVESGS